MPPRQTPKAVQPVLATAVRTKLSSQQLASAEANLRAWRVLRDEAAVRPAMYCLQFLFWFPTEPEKDDVYAIVKDVTQENAGHDLRVYVAASFVAHGYKHTEPIATIGRKESTPLYLREFMQKLTDAAAPKVSGASSGVTASSSEKPDLLAALTTVQEFARTSVALQQELEKVKRAAAVLSQEKTELSGQMAAAQAQANTLAEQLRQSRAEAQQLRRRLSTVVKARSVEAETKAAKDAAQRQLAEAMEERDAALKQIATVQDVLTQGPATTKQPL